VQLVLETLRQAGNVPTILEDNAPVAAVDSYGDSAINYTLRVWCNSADYWNTKCAVLEQVKVLFDEKGVEMTYPHLNVHLNS
jgi:small conductance mechanosensitive channel